MAYRLLRIDVRELRSSTRTGDEYLIALRTSGLRQGWPWAGDLAPREAFYQPQLLRGPDERTHTWEEALETSGHLVFTGPSGTGKSMLLRHVATTLAQRRLDGDQQEWHPVLLHARHLAQHGSLVDALFHGATEAVAPELHRSLAPDHFDRTRFLGGGWCSSTASTRCRTATPDPIVLARLRTAAALPSMRVVVASRPLHQRDHELLSATFSEYTLNALDNAGIESFVARVVRPHEPSTSASRRTGPALYRRAVDEHPVDGQHDLHAGERVAREAVTIAAHRHLRGHETDSTGAAGRTSSSPATPAAPAAQPTPRCS